MEMWERVVVFDSDFEHSPKRARLDGPSMELGDNLNSSIELSADETSTVHIGDGKEIPSGSEPNIEEKPENITSESGATCDDEDDDDDDDDTSTVSNVSDISLMSDMSGQEWKPVNANIVHVMAWVQKQMMKGISPRKVFSQIIGDCNKIPDFVSDNALWNIIMAYLTDEPPRRSRLPNVTSLDHVISLLKKSNKIMVLTGAGVSVSCGIPDFRSKDGVYARLAVDFPDLPDPQAMFDIKYFRKDPRPFFKFAKEMYPGQFRPSPCHRFIKMLEKHKKLLRNYTQNIDTLEKVAGIENVIECHGSFATASCTQCGHKVPCDDIKGEVLNQEIPYCKKCPEEAEEGCERGVMKPDIVFFGEGLPERFHEAVAQDKDECDLLIVIGSSLKVRPVALIPNSLPSHIPQILINRERLPHKNFDVELLGDSDVIVDYLCKILGDEWKEICWRDNVLSDVTSQLPPAVDYRSDTSSFGDSEDEDAESNDDQSVVSSPAQPQTSETSSDVAPIEGETVVKCQKIGKRHIPGDDSSRHISLESSRDSGIGESSNSSNEGGSPHPSTSPMPDNCFYCLTKRRYIFPGAEVQGLPSFLLNTV